MLRLLAAPLALLSAAVAGQETLPPGIWTNNEDAYFAEEEGRDEVKWQGIEVRTDGAWRAIDAYGAPLGLFHTSPIPGLAAREGGSGWQIGTSELRRAREFSCWLSVRRTQAKADGTPDWTFANNLKIFDQGGRVFVVGEGAAPAVTIRMRNVTWASGSRNKPSLVLYVHTDDPERAESYSWADPDAALVGINLRWMQGSCARADAAVAPEQRKASLAAQGERWLAFHQSGNWTALRTLYADDAVLMTQGQERIVGADAIIAFLRRVADTGGRAQFVFENEDVSHNGDIGFITAKYRMTITLPQREPITVAGRSFLVYKWHDGQWKLWRDMDNLAPDVTPENFGD